jgi:RecJ-like exonuclease
MAKGISFRSCGSCRGRGHIQVTVKCLECEGRGTVNLPVTHAAKGVLAAYQKFLDQDQGGLEILRDALTELQEAIDGD